MKKCLLAFMALGAILLFTLALAGCKTGGGTDGTPTPTVTPAPTFTPTPTPTQPPVFGNKVEMKGIQFQPRQRYVLTGDTVVWTNNDPVDHTVTPTDKALWGTEGSGDNVSQWLKQGETWSFTFTTPGAYKYYCIPHASKNSKGEYVGMVGEIIVVDGASTATVTYVDVTK